MFYEDIQQHLEELYGLDISTGQLSAITDKVLPLMEAWRSRPLEAVYAFVWLDAVHFKVRQDGKVVRAASAAKPPTTSWRLICREKKTCLAFTSATPRAPASG